MLIIDPGLPDQSRIYKMPHKFSLVYALPNNCADYLFLWLAIFKELGHSSGLFTESSHKVGNQMLLLRTHI